MMNPDSARNTADDNAAVDRSEVDTDPPRFSTSWSEFPFLMMKGFVMGSADIVPGVSGGTMALILGIYSRLIHAIESFNLLFFRRIFTLKLRAAFSGVQWRFLAMLGGGIIAAVIFFTRVVPLQVYMFTHPELIYGLFFGLIVGSIWILFKAIEQFGWPHALALVAGVAIGFWVVTLVPTDTSESPLFLFFSGSIAISAMVLPGISGSYILLILRKYDYILTQLSKIGTPQTVEGLLILLPFLLGAGIGLILFARLLSWLLDRWYAKTLAVLIGFLIGSLIVIWPYQDRQYEEFVSVEEVVAVDSERAVDLRDEPDVQERPEYQRLGETEDGTVEILQVKRKMVGADPYIPWVTVEGTRTDSFWDGVMGLGIGFLMVFALDWLRSRD